MTDFASSGSFGIMGLEERAHLFGGKVIVDSMPQNGTSIHLVIPRQPTSAKLDLPAKTPPPSNSKHAESQLVVDQV